MQDKRLGVFATEHIFLPAVRMQVARAPRGLKHRITRSLQNSLHVWVFKSEGQAAAFQSK